MVYFYYGFFLFLLYMTAPLWMFLLVASGSWWGMRSSFAFQKNMRIPLARLGWLSQQALEPLGALRKDPSPSSLKLPASPRLRRTGRGTSHVWAERRRFDRVAASLRVAYLSIGNGRKKETASRSLGRLAAESRPFWARPFHSGEAATLDISEGGLSLEGENPLAVGERLKLSLQLPQSETPILLLAEVCSFRASFQPGKTTYKMGLKILDLGLEEMVQLANFLFDERQRAA